MTEFLRNAPVSEVDRLKISPEKAEKLLHLRKRLNARSPTLRNFTRPSKRRWSRYFLRVCVLIRPLKPYCFTVRSSSFAAAFGSRRDAQQTAETGWMLVDRSFKKVADFRETAMQWTVTIEGQTNMVKSNG